MGAGGSKSTEEIFMFFLLGFRILLKHSQLLCNKPYFFGSFKSKKTSAKSINLSLTLDFLQPGSQFMLHARKHVPISADELDPPLCHFWVISFQVELYSEPFSFLPPQLQMSATFTMCKVLLVDKSLSNTTEKTFYDGF